MASLRFKELYAKSPLWLQNVMVSAYGWQRHRQRYSGQWAAHVQSLLASQWWSAEQFAEYQRQRLQTLVAHSMRHVPYYRELYRQFNIDPAGLTDIKQLPLLEKDTLRTELQRCVAECWPRRTLLEFHTSGSTGTPLTHLMNQEDFRERMAFLERQRRWAGVHEGDRCATFGGALLVSPGQERAPLWRYNYIGRQLVLSSYHLSPQNLPHYVKRLTQFDPRIIEGYPSALYLIARWLEEQSMTWSGSLRAMLATGETLHDYQRTMIEKSFRTTVYNYYGSSESAPLITQCEHKQLHINPESGIFEFLRPDGSDATPGEVAELVVTSFATRAMPLIRYRIRDAAILDETDVCACGRHMPRVKTIIGRLDDMVYTPDRGWVGRLSQAVKVFPGSIREAQIVQDDINNITIKLVPDDKRFDESQLTPLIADLRSRLGDVVNLNITYVSSIPRGANNKFKYVVCNLPAAEKQRLRMYAQSELIES